MNDTKLYQQILMLVVQALNEPRESEQYFDCLMRIDILLDELSA